MIYILGGACMAVKIKTAKIIKLEDFKKSRSIVFVLVQKKLDLLKNHLYMEV